MKNYNVWLSYDLGYGMDNSQIVSPIDNEDYQARYNALKKWLDEKNAKPCGYSVALFPYEGKEGIKVEKALKEDIIKAFTDDNIKDLTGMRIYAIISGEIELKEKYWTLFYYGYILE